MPNEELPELLPCPFCGKKPDVSRDKDENLWDHRQVDWTMIQCAECDIFMRWPSSIDSVRHTKTGTLATLR